MGLWARSCDRGLVIKIVVDVKAERSRFQLANQTTTLSRPIVVLVSITNATDVQGKQVDMPVTPWPSVHRLLKICRPRQMTIWKIQKMCIELFKETEYGL